MTELLKTVLTDPAARGQQIKTAAAVSASAYAPWSSGVE